MRLTEQQKELVLGASRRHIYKPTLVRLGDSWGVVGRDADHVKLWAGLILKEIDSVGGVWWTGHTFGLRKRSDVMANLTMEAAR